MSGAAGFADATGPDALGRDAIGLVHLVWAPLGPEPLRAFLRSYRAHRPGFAQQSAIVLNRDPPPDANPARSYGVAGVQRQSVAEAQTHGLASGVQPQSADRALSREALLAELQGVEHRLLVLDRPVPDLAAYGQAARALTNARLCFLNSYSVVLADDWLAALADALSAPNVGLAGATASWESQSQWIRGKARYWPYQLALRSRARRDYPPFPNPHIRTTAFMIEREIVLAMSLDAVADKRAAYLLESGRRRITRQVLERGLRAVVTGRDGRVYGVKDWAGARTYRSGAQENLLVADNRTRDWEAASPRLRRRLSHDAWGDRYLGEGGL